MWSEPTLKREHEKKEEEMIEWEIEAEEECR